MTEDKKEALLARIRAMTARTVENGCTEAEAMQAAAMVTKLLDTYGFSEADLTLPPEKITEESYIPGSGVTKQIGEMIYCTPAIADYCDCKVWSLTIGGQPSAIKYFGRESDAAVAMYMTHLIHTAMQRAWKDYLPNRDTSVRRTPARKALQRGMAVRIAQRLREMKKARSAEVDVGSGRQGQELVVLKNAVVDAAWAERNLKFKNSKRGAPNIKSNAAFAAGYVMGGEVQLNSGITGGKPALRIVGGKG